MADQKLIDITDLLRQEQVKTTSEIITTRHSIQEMSNGISEGLSFLPSKEESRGMSDVQSIEYSLELANVRDDLRDGFQSVVDAVNGMKLVLPSRESQEEEENESDKQHEELISTIKDIDGDDKKKKKGGGFLGGLLSGVGSIGKGLFSGLSTFFGLFGKLGKFFIGPVFKGIGTVMGGIMTGLKWLFKGLGLVALIGGGIAVAAFLSLDKKDQEEKIEKFKNFITKSWEFVKTLGEAFKVGFLTNMEDDKDSGTEGLKTKFNNFKVAWGKAFAKLDDIKLPAVQGLGGPYTGLAGIANLVGDIFGKVAGWMIDLGTGIGNLIASPTETIARFQVKIESFFIGIADSLGQMFDRFFNMENLLKILESMGVPIPDQMMLTAAGKRIREKQNEIKRIDKLDKTLQDQADNARIKLAKEQARVAAIEKKGGEADKTKLRNLSLSITAAEEQIKRNVDIRKFNKEVIIESATTAAQELKNQKIKKATGLDLQEKEEDIKEMKEDAAEIREKKISSGGGGMKVSAGESIVGEVSTFQALRDLMRQQFDMNIEQGQEMKKTTAGRKSLFDVVKGGVTKEFIKTKEGQRFISELADLGLLTDRGLKFGRQEKGDDSHAAAADKINKFLLRGLKQQGKIDALTVKITDITNEVKEKVKSVEDVIGTEAKNITAAKYGVDVKDIKIEGTRQTGGRISKTGLYKLHANEIVFDPPSSDKIDNFVASYLPQSGATINQLQLARTTGIPTGTSEPVIIDNSSQPTIINQTNIASPQTRGNPLPGMGRDLGVTHLKYG